MRDSFDPEWLTPQQVADLTQLSYKTIMRAIWSRRLRATQHAENGPWRVRLEDYDAWMQGVTPPVSLPQRHITPRAVSA